MPKYYALESSGNEADLYIFGDITTWPWDEKDRDAYGIVKELQSLEADKLNVHINSYGGDVSEGLAIYNVLKNSQIKITTYCDGFACSAASVIFMAGDERIMNSASLLMIHNAWSRASGNANEFRKKAVLIRFFVKKNIIPTHCRFHDVLDQQLPLPIYLPWIIFCISEIFGNLFAYDHK